MRLTRDQQACVEWLGEVGGSALMDGCGFVVSGRRCLPPQVATTFLRLVMLGLVEGGHGRLSLTARGREEAARIDGDRREAEAKLAAIVEKLDEPS